MHWVIWLLGALLFTGTLSGCSGRSAEEANPDPYAVEAASLREPIGEAVTHLEQLMVEANRGDLSGVDNAYQAFGLALGKVLPPLSFHDGELARRLANAHSAMREQLNAEGVKSGLVIREAGQVRAALLEAATALEIPLSRPATAPAVPEASGVHEITLMAKEYEFQPSLIDVKAGQTVRIKLSNEGSVTHQWRLDDLQVKIDPVPPGAVGEVLFVADRPGTYVYRCTIGDHQERGMRGVLRVQQ